MTKGVLCYYMIFMVSCLVHELGYIIMAKIPCDIKNYRIELSTGKSIADFRKFAIKSIPIAGYGCRELEDLERYNKSDKLRRIMPTLGGSLFSLTMAVLSIILYKKSSKPNKLVNHMTTCSVVANAGFFVATILSMRYPNCSSDGMHIFNILKLTKEV